MQHPRIQIDHPLYNQIRHLYDMFRSHPPDTVGVCHDCGHGCMNLEEAHLLLKEPVEEVSEHILWRWYSTAVPNPIPVHVQRYLFPRIVEGMVAEEELDELEQPLRHCTEILSTVDADIKTELQSFILSYWRWAAENDASCGCDLDIVFLNLVAGGWDKRLLLQELLKWPDEIFFDRDFSEGLYQFCSLWEEPEGKQLLNRFISIASKEGAFQSDAEFIVPIIQEKLTG